jgi:glycosyltransferase involved in cell wall biosynthesis
MRIALFTDTFPPTLNGVARALGLLVDHAYAAGHEIAVVTPTVRGEPHPRATLQMELPSVELPFYRELQAALPALGGRRRRALEAFAPDIVHVATEAPVGMAGRRWALRRGLPLVTSYCTNFPDYLPGYGLGLLRDPLWAFLRRFHAAARTSFAPSPTTIAELRQRGFHHRWRVWGRGVDAELFHPSRRSDELRASMAPGADIVLLYVGRIAPEKRIEVVMQALPLIRAGLDARVDLVLVGGGPAREELERRRIPGVHFAGYQRGEELAAHYASADLFLFPSDTETFGQVVTEAMASGLPVVAPDRGGVRDTVLHGRTGLRVEPGDPVAMAEAALSILRAPDRRIVMAAEARKSAEARSWETVFRGLFADYEDAVRGTVTPRPIRSDEAQPA